MAMDNENRSGLFYNNSSYTKVGLYYILRLSQFEVLKFRSAPSLFFVCNPKMANVADGNVSVSCSSGG